MQTFTNDARLIGDNVHMLRMGLREMKQPFYLARTIFSDEVKSRTKLTQVQLSANRGVWEESPSTMCAPCPVI